MDFPNNIKTADFAISVAKLNMFRKEGFKMPAGKPHEVAERWAKDIGPSDLILSATADSGYLNILLNPKVTISSVIGTVLEKRELYGNFDFQRFGHDLPSVQQFVERDHHRLPGSCVACSNG